MNVLVRALRAGVIVVMVYAPTPLTAQAVSPGEGLRVRVYAPTLMETPAVGNIAAALPGYVSVIVGDRAARVDIPAIGVTRIDVSVGKSRARGALIGAGVFGLTGLAAGVAAGTTMDEENEGLISFVLGLGGLASGLTLGGIGGAIWAPERWTPAPLFPPQMGASVYGRTRVTLLDGARVRLTSATLDRVKVRASASDSLGFNATYDGITRRIAWNEAERVDVRGGRDRQRGAAYEAAAGALLAIIPGAIDRHRGGLSKSEYANVIVGNTLIGGLVGVLLAPRGWQPLPIPIPVPAESTGR